MFFSSLDGLGPLIGDILGDGGVVGLLSFGGVFGLPGFEPLWRFVLGFVPDEETDVEVVPVAIPEVEVVALGSTY